MKNEKRIIENEDGTINIPLNKQYTVIIGRYGDGSGYQCAIEEVIPMVDNVKYLEQLEVKRYEEFKILKDELKDLINKGNQYLVFSNEGVNNYQLMKYEDGLGFTSDGINYH